jgi:hypothetical protein
VKKKNSSGNLKKTDGENPKKRFKRVWFWAIIIPLFCFLSTFVLKGTLINLYPGCTNAFVTSIEETTSGPTEKGPGEKLFKVKYQYQVKGRTYKFKQTFSWMNLVAIKGMNNPKSQIIPTVSLDQIRYIPIKYYKHFPWYHTITNNCEE